MAIYELGGVCPNIAPTAWVHETAVVAGDVTLGDGASVWPGAVLRGDIAPIRVGAGSNIQDNAVVHVLEGAPCTVAEDVSVGHGAVLHGCTVKAGALIGMGAVVLNGAVIEEGALVGAGALVAEGRTVPAGKLAVGSPARVVRSLSGEERARILANTRGYAAEKDRFSKARRIDLPAPAAPGGAER
ncbi:MAG: gamma carbonic anhydrase family protein [Duodenibacillus sp.]|nr:gamma carbonic anhydrase family protein [Duodenibacillus sp.]